MGVPRLLIPIGSNINTENITNEPGSIIEHMPNLPPTLLASPILPPEIQQHLQFLLQQAYQLVGINELTTAGKKPAGLNSGAALREMTDIQGDRFAVVEQNYENFFLEIARQAILLAQSIYEETGEYQVSTHNSKGFSKIDWGSIDMSSDDFIMKQYPTNLLPKTPSGKLQQLSEMMQQNLIDVTQAKRLMDFPDLDAVNALDNAPLDNIYKQIELIIENDTYSTPEPYQDLQNGIKIFQNTLLKYETQRTARTEIRNATSLDSPS